MFFGSSCDLGNPPAAVGCPGDSVSEGLRSARMLTHGGSPVPPMRNRDRQGADRRENTISNEMRRATGTAAFHIVKCIGGRSIDEI